MEPLTIRLKTLTPIWTGGVDTNRMDRLHETGIIGSLRWWYEVLVRGLGNYACNPINSNCNEEKHCASCELFGCTGWGRKFRLEIQGTIDYEDRKQEQYKCSDASHRHRGWFIRKGITSENLLIKIIPLREISEDEFSSLWTCLKILIERAGIGSRNQLGFGIVDYYDSKNKEKFANIQIASLKASSDIFPNLPDFIFCEMPASNSNNLNLLIDIKCKLRELFRDISNFALTDSKEMKILRHFIMGTTSALRLCPVCLGSNFSHDNSEKSKLYCHFHKGSFLKKELIRVDKMASKIFVSRPFQKDGQTQMRIWGWIPKRLPYNVKREKVLDVIKDTFNAKQSDFIDLSVQENVEKFFA